jgi:ABC-type nickel/cobalt efflux system permease component RcnA
MALALFAGAISTSPAAAHPMGNVSVSHYAGLEIGPREIGVKFLLDYAEIPSVPELDRIDSDSDDLVTPEEREAYLDEKTEQVLPRLRLEVNGTRVPLRRIWSHVTFPPGEGGLSTVRIAWQLRAELPEDLLRSKNFLVWNDSNDDRRDGWKEIRITGLGGIGIGSSSLGSLLRSNELSEYPEEYLYNPPRDTKAWCHFGPGLTAPEPETPGAAGFEPPPGFGTEGRKDPFVALVRAEDLTPGVIALSLLLAFLLGAGHALEPGHGKAVVGAYLVGTRGTLAQAAALGLIVTLTHTFSVFLLGIVALFLSRFIVPEALLPRLGLVSGLLIAAVGGWMLRARLRERGAARAAPRASASAPRHAHAHAHDHPHPLSQTPDPAIEAASEGGGTHTHVPQGKATLGSILALGISGGLVPCSGGIVVLLAAVALGRIAFGLLLIVAFSLGLAVVLFGVGAMFVTARRLFDRYIPGGSFMTNLGIASATVVMLFGLLLVWRSLTGGATHPI